MSFILHSPDSTPPITAAIEITSPETTKADQCRRNCWEYHILGTVTKFLPGATDTSLIPSPTTTVLTSWAFEEGDPPQKRHEQAKRYPPIVNRDSVEERDGDATVVVTQTCSETITLSATKTLTISDPTITTSTTVWASTVTEWVQATSYCGPNNINC